ncbi:MAG: hypothetical protein P8X81_00840 [Woeseiaceae bacterium]|jgi:hypothetical protein
MRALFVRYLNEIVGLTVMALMTLALVAGEADAELRRTAMEEGHDVIEIRFTVAD